MEVNDIYPPCTLNELIDGLKGIIHKSKDLTGDEYITDIMVINDDFWQVPPNSIAMYVVRATMDPDLGEAETIIISPKKANPIM